MICQSNIYYSLVTFLNMILRCLIVDVIHVFKFHLFAHMLHKLTVISFKVFITGVNVFGFMAKIP